MTATNSPSPPPRRRWYQSRKLRWLTLLLAAGAGAYFILPSLLMPADLRAMQGTWQMVRATENGKESPRPAEKIFISGSRLGIQETRADGSIAGIVWTNCGVVAERQELALFDEEELQLLGRTYRWPAWLRAPRHAEIMNYEITATRFVLRSGNEEYFLERP